MSLALCSSLPLGAGVTGVFLQTCFVQCWGLNQELCECEHSTELSYILSPCCNEIFIFLTMWVGGVLCRGIYIYTCVQVPTGWKHQIPWNGVTASSRLPDLGAKNLDPLQEQYISLAAEARLQANILHQVRRANGRHV